jgi:hypothetical protein
MPTAKPMVQDGFEYREMNKAEFEQYKIDQAEAQQAILDAAKKAEEKQAIIQRLGLTADELSILLS